jgi:hypothetical protein
MKDACGSRVGESLGRVLGEGAWGGFLGRVLGEGAWGGSLGRVLGKCFLDL